MQVLAVAALHALRVMPGVIWFQLESLSAYEVVNYATSSEVLFNS